MDEQQIQQLLRLEKDFVNALSNGAEGVAAFNESFSAFVSLAGTPLSLPAAELGVQVACRIQHVVENLLALELNSLTIYDEMIPALDSVVNPPQQTPSVPISTSPSSWLMNNLSNPYPSRKELQNLATATKQPTHALISWFSTARQRIGWTALRSSHYFSGSKTKILEAATLYFEKNTVLPYGLDAEFAKIEHAARKLYSEKVNSTQLMSGLDDRIKSLDPELKTVVKELKQKEKQVAADRAKEHHEFLRYRHFVELKQRQAEYLKEAFPGRWSSPGPSEIGPSSPESFRESSVVSEDACASELDEVQPSPVIGLKRRRDDDEVQLQSQKRTRVALPLPTLPNSTIKLLPEPSPITSPPNFHSTLHSTGSSRKRRLSESDCQGLPKRVCTGLGRSTAVPQARLNAVSSPLTVSPSSPPSAAAKISCNSPMREQGDFDLASLLSWDVSVPLPADYAICVRDPTPLHAAANETLERSVSPSLFSTDGSTTDDDSDSEGWIFSASSSTSPPAFPGDLWESLPQDDKTPTAQTFPVIPPSSTKPELTTGVLVTSPEPILPASYHPSSALHDEL